MEDHTITEPPSSQGSSGKKKKEREGSKQI